MTNDPYELKIILEKLVEDNQRMHQKLNNLERHVVNFIYPTQDLQKLLNSQFAPLTIDDRNLKVLLKEFRQIQSEFQININAVNLDQTLSEMKYIGKRMNEIEIALKEIKENGLRKEVKLEFSCDGYELVKKPKGYSLADEIEKPLETLQDIIKKLSRIESHILVNKLGLFGMKKQTYVSIGKELNITRERTRQIYAKAIRKLRTKEISGLVKKSGNIYLIEEVFGKS